MVTSSSLSWTIFLAAARSERTALDRIERVVGTSGLQRLQETHVLTVGTGSLGTRLLSRLARRGYGRLDLIDRDVVMPENLGTTELITNDDIGASKAIAVASRLTGVSILELEIRALTATFDDAVAAGIIGNPDTVAICTDSFDSRIEIARWCRERGLPVVTGGVSIAPGTWGWVAIDQSDGPCLQCLLRRGVDIRLDQEESCSVGSETLVTDMVAAVMIYALEAFLLGRYCPWNVRRLALPADFELATRISPEPGCPHCASANRVA